MRPFLKAVRIESVLYKLKQSSRVVVACYLESASVMSSYPSLIHFMFVSSAPRLSTSSDLNQAEVVDATLPRDRAKKDWFLGSTA